MPMTLSPGSSSARYAAMLALAPECGCTLAWSAPNSSHRRVAGELLGLVDHEVAAVVALARVALGVLVGEHRALRREHRGRGEVLRRDELDRGVLALGLAPDDVGDLGIGRGAARRSSVRHRISPFSMRGDLVDAALVAAALEVGGEPDPQDLVGQALAHDARADRQHVGVVVPARVLGGVEVVAERGAHALHLVGRDLLALAAAAEHDAALGVARRPPRGRRAAQ